MLRLLAGICGLMLMITSCGTSAPSRSSVLSDLANEIVVPAYQKFEMDANALRDSLDRLCTQPNISSLSQAKAQLSATSASWAYLEAMWVGPVQDRRSWALIRWPISIEQIEGLIADTDIELDGDRLAKRVGADQRGLGAVYYLINALSSSEESAANNANNTEVLSSLVTQPRRCAYALTAAEVLATEAKIVTNGWTTDWQDNGPYSSQFGDVNGDGLDSVVNDVVFLLQSMTDLELGAVLDGLGTAQESTVVLDDPAGAAIYDIASRLRGARDVLLGSQDEPAAGLAPLVDEELSSRLTTQFEKAQDAVNNLGVDLDSKGPLQTQTLATARDQLKALQIIVSTEVASFLGVAIGFSDADGDSSG